MGIWVSARLAAVRLGDAGGDMSGGGECSAAVAAAEVTAPTDGTEGR